MTNSTKSRFLSSRFLLSSVIAVLFLNANYVFAQAGSDAERKLFQEQLKSVEEAKTAKAKDALTQDKAPDNRVDFQAPQIEYLKDQDTVRGSGGVLISAPPLRVQANEATFNQETKDANLKGEVVFSGETATISAADAQVNLESELGDFSKCEFALEDPGFEIAAEEAKKLSEFEFEVQDTELTTCHCLDSSKPWSIHARRAHITQEGYAHTYGATLDVYGVPIFYSPYFAFPVKLERASGLLVPKYGYSDQDGFKYEQPIFVALDESSDFTLSPFVEARTRNGAKLAFNNTVSRFSNYSGKIDFSNERPRDGDLRGVNITGITDASIDDDRVGGYFYQLWKNRSDSTVPLTYVADLHYASDDLFLREMDEPLIGGYSQRYVTSSALFRAGLGESALAQLSGEYNQAIFEDDDTVPQRLPQGSLFGLTSFRPFGFNPYGVKVVAKGSVDSVEFDRKVGFDGNRTDINPELQIPFHFENYFRTTFGFGVHQTYYRMNERALLSDPSILLDREADRTVANMGADTYTDFERSFALSDDSWLTQLSGLGSTNQSLVLKRLKHTITPFVTYNFVPDTSQDKLPLYDSLDRIREKSYFVYGVSQSLFGRFLPPNQGSADIVELTPRVDDLPVFGGAKMIEDIGSAEVGDDQNVSLRNGEVRELVRFGIQQGYDYKVDIDQDPNTNPQSDISTALTLNPNGNFSQTFQSEVNPYNPDFTSWSSATALSDDRGDIINLKYSFFENQISQFQPSLELRLTDRLQLGYYARYDRIEREFIDNMGALRFSSSCNCWFFDIGFRDRINPDKQEVTVRFTFTGLGDLTQDLLLPRQDKLNSSN